MISRMPSQKIGIDTPTRANREPAASKTEFFFTAAITPSRIPRTDAKMIAATASSIVAGKRAPISRATEDFV